MDDQRQVVLSGIRATGQMHLGNYLGAIRYFVDLAQQDDYHCFFFIANLHTLTTPVDPVQMQHDLREIVIDFLAAGLDPERSTIYAQSSVPEISELAWLLGCLTPVNNLLGMPHFKEKRDKLEHLGTSANAGLLTYPVLMAADILAPRANLVPVGEDQHPHVELARDIARRFNAQFGTLFPIPGLLENAGVRVPSLTGEGKMAKSESDGSILLVDSPESIERKFRQGVTDPARKRRQDPGNPDNCPIFSFHQLLSTPEELRWASHGCRSAEIGCIECKAVVAKHVRQLLEPFQERRREITARGTLFVDEILHDGGKRARARIAETVNEAKRRMGVPEY